MKRKLLAALAAVMCLSFSACGDKTNVSSGETSETMKSVITGEPSEITAAVLAEIPINSALEKGIDDLGFYFTDLDTSGLEAASYYMCASGAYPDEIAVFKFNSSELAEQGKAAVQARLEKQISVYESYTPEEMYKLDDAVVEVKENYVFYFVTENNSRAGEIMNSYVS